MLLDNTSTLHKSRHSSPGPGSALSSCHDCLSARHRRHLKEFKTKEFAWRSAGSNKQDWIRSRGLGLEHPAELTRRRQRHPLIRPSMLEESTFLAVFEALNALVVAGASDDGPPLTAVQGAHEVDPVLVSVPHGHVWIVGGRRDNSTRNITAQDLFGSQSWPRSKFFGGVLSMSRSRGSSGATLETRVQLDIPQLARENIQYKTQTKSC